jgi:alpha-galactosidase
LASAMAFITMACGGALMAEATDHSGSYISNSHATSSFVAEDFIPDGNLNKPVWRGALWIKFEHDAFSARAYPQSATEIASLWTPQYVYFAFRCQYATLNLFEGKDPSQDFWTLWDRDVVEVFLNPQPERMNHYYEFEVAPNNLWIDLEIDLDKKPFNDPQWNSGFEHATHIDAQNHVWTCELRIPVRALGVTQPTANAEWRINFYRADGPGNDTQRRFLSWSPVHSDTHTFHTPASFGLIRFVK